MPRLMKGSVAIASRPGAFDEAAEHDGIGVEEPRLEQTPDLDAAMTDEDCAATLRSSMSARSACG